MTRLRCLLLLGLAASCADTTDSPSPTGPSIQVAPSSRRCVPPANTSGSPTSIAEAMALLAALPSPVSIACFVESLDRPLHVFATASPFSAQPAPDVHSPRIFIRNGPLTMVVVPAGMGSALLEFSEHAGPGRSIKGEVELPLQGELAPTAAFDRVRVDSGTSCGTCHDDEAPTSGSAFASEVLHPLPEYDVSLAQLRGEATACGRRPGPRCALLRALFDHGEVRQGALPDGGRVCHS